MEDERKIFWYRLIFYKIPENRNWHCIRKDTVPVSKCYIRWGIEEDWALNWDGVIPSVLRKTCEKYFSSSYPIQ